MKLGDFISSAGFEIINGSGNMDTELSKVFCCDLLSFAMSRNPAGSVWVTVMGNVNTVAVAVLTDGGCIVIAESAMLDPSALEKAKQQGVTVLRTELPVFDAALKAHKLIVDK